jgi:hypothetical protein
MKYLKGVLILLFASTFFVKTYSQSSVAGGQAIFLYNFTRLIEWPESYKSGNFVMGVYGASELFDELQSYTNGKSVGSQAIKVVKFASAADIGKCHILFIGYGKTKEMAAIMGKIGNASTLVVTERFGGLDAGATINFVLKEDKLKYEIKSSNGLKVGLKIHSNLENMAYAKY